MRRAEPHHDARFPRRLPGRVFGLACLALLGTPVLAAPLADSLFVTNWYTVTIMGTRSGYSCQSLRREADGVESFEQTVLRIKLGQKTLTAAREERRHYDRDLRLTRIEHKADQVGRKLQITALREGDLIRYVKQSPDGETRGEVPLPPDFGQELKILAAIGDEDLGPAWKQSFVTFDCDLLKLDTVSLEVLSAVKEPRPGWLLAARSTLLGLETRTTVSADGTLLRQEIPGMLGMAMELATEQEALAELSPLLLSSEVRVKQELGAPRQLAALTLCASARTGSAAEMLPTTHRQTVTPQGQEALVSLRAETPPELTARLPVTDPALAPFLKASDLAQSGDAALRSKAQAIVGQETDAWKAACLLAAWVHRSVKKMESEPRPVSALEILGSLQGDCTEHSILLAALAQAVGLPVKIVAGLAYSEKAFHYHAWNAVWVGRWVEMDATWGEETVDAGHLAIAQAALDGPSMARLSLASGRTMGSLELDITDFTTRDGPL